MGGRSLLGLAVSCTAATGARAICTARACSRATQAFSAATSSCTRSVALVDTTSTMAASTSANFTTIISKARASSAMMSRWRLKASSLKAGGTATEPWCLKMEISMKAAGMKESGQDATVSPATAPMWHTKAKRYIRVDFSTTGDMEMGLCGSLAARVKLGQANLNDKLCSTKWASSQKTGPVRRAALLGPSAIPSLRWPRRVLQMQIGELGQVRSQNGPFRLGL
mmetsp:Transcript_72008/g.116751  ORF Transcript_72008/g.116751 Transcript_72008/m.116751 type:complete len:225 (+) Transcript_72008:375-1049(+)